MATLTTVRRNLFVFVVGFCAFLPGLLAPYWLDDYVHKAMVRGNYPSPRSPFDLYNFVTDGDRALLIDRGVLPWWTHPHLTIRFFRPLASALRWLDYVVSDSPLLHHAHSFVWWALTVVAARALYRQWLSPRALWMATFVFALAPCHAIPVSWLANREVLVSLAFGTFALGAFARYLRDGTSKSAALAVALFSMAMLAGEYSLAFGAYVLSFAFFSDASRARRLRALATFAVPACATLIARVVLGFGNAGSGFYRDPFTQTEAFVSGAPRRLAHLWIDAWISSDADWAIDTRWWLVALFVVTLTALVAIPIRRAMRATEDSTRRAAKALLVGSVGALVPMVAALPSQRLLGVAMLGVAFVVALALDHGWFGEHATNDFSSLVVLLLGFMHLVHGPVTTFLSARMFRETAVGFSERNDWLRHHITGDPALADVAVARSGWQVILFSSFALDPNGRLPRHWWVLSLVPHALMLRRGATSVDLVVPKGRGYFPTGPDDLFRSTDLPLRAGDEVRVPGMRAKVIEVGENGPGRVHFDFDEKLEDIVWIADGRDGWKEVELPQRGFGIPLDP